ncbi:zinc finger protein with SET domain, putative [Theileria annulata]|uniref:Zinc finger protein with SET domain, putative n=1 Tax=Theileria annulata TaxID=5874 RepID=Q4UH58_THEAN|nr:zinc finger protein with SET domain, putative [Theileria annulata]CAI73581.1 zinc finger protein with SET domain, putative [Theileria annulata]|eukprot:XP_954258.1 zinc finger protein with SET domain, putative [Theileria annulata]
MNYCSNEPVLGSLLSYADWCKESEEEKLHKRTKVKVKRSNGTSKPDSVENLRNSSENNGEISNGKQSKTNKEPEKRKRYGVNGSESKGARDQNPESMTSDSYIDLLELANYSSDASSKNTQFKSNTTTSMNNNGIGNMSTTSMNNLNNGVNNNGKNSCRKRMDLREVSLERLSTLDSLGSRSDSGGVNFNVDSEEFKYESLLSELRRRGFEPKTLGDVLRSRNKQWAKTQCIHSSAKEDFERHLNMYKNHFRSYRKTLDGWIPKSCNVNNNNNSKGNLSGKMGSRRNFEKLTWSNIIFCPNFRPGGEIIYRFSRKTMKTYNTLYDTINKGWVHPDLLVCLVRDASHPVRFATPPEQDCYTAIYTGPEISENLDTKVIFGEYTGIVYREDCVPDSIFEYAFELNFTSASWVDAELEFRHDKQYIRDVNGTIFLPNNSKYVLDSTHAFNELSMVNHCQSIAAYGGEYFLQANCEWQQVIFDGWPHVILTNKQGVKIQTGDELIADFGALWFQKVEENCHRQLKRELISYRLLSTANKSDNNPSNDSPNDEVQTNKVKNSILVQELPNDKSLNNLDYFVVNNNTSYVCAICLDEDLNDYPNTSTKKILTHRKNSTMSTQTLSSDTTMNTGQNAEEYRDEDDEDECIVCDGCDRIFHIKCLEKITTTALNYVQTEFQNTKFINFQAYLRNNKYTVSEGNLINLNLIKWYCMYCRYLCKQIIQHDLNQDFMPLQSCIYINTPESIDEIPNSSQNSSSSQPETSDNTPETSQQDSFYPSSSVNVKSEESNEKKEAEADPESDESEVELVNNNLIDLNKITNYINKLIYNTSNSPDNSATSQKENTPTPKDNYNFENHKNADNVEGGKLEKEVGKRGKKNGEKEYPKHKRKKIKSCLSLNYLKRKNRRKMMVKNVKTKSKLFKGNKTKTLKRIKLINKPTSLEISKYLVKQKILSNTTNKGQIRLFGNYINFRTYCCPTGSPRSDTNEERNNTAKNKIGPNSVETITSSSQNPNYMVDQNNKDKEADDNELTINLFNLGLISLNMNETSELLEAENKTASTEETCSTTSGNELDLSLEDANNCNVVYSELLRKCNDTINSRNSGSEKVNSYDTLTKAVNSPVVKDNQSSDDSTNPTNSPTFNNATYQQIINKVKDNPDEVLNVSYDNSIMNNIIDYLNCRYLMGMWQVEPFSIFGEAVRVCVDCNKKCGPKANVYVCRVLKRHLSGNFDHPKSTNVEQMKELILISFEQHINYLLRLLVLKNIIIDFLIKLSCHFLTSNNHNQSNSCANTTDSVTTGKTGDTQVSEENSKKDETSCFKDIRVNNVEENLEVGGSEVTKNSELVEKTQKKLTSRSNVKKDSVVGVDKNCIYNNVNEFIKCISNNIKRIPQGDILFNYELLKSLGGFEEDFVRIINCDDLFKYINDLSSYMCYNSDQVPSSIQQILSKDELMRFTHFRKYLIKDVNLFVNTSSNIPHNNVSGEKAYQSLPKDTSEYNSEVCMKSELDQVIKSTNCELEYWDPASRRFSDEVDEDTVKINLNNVIRINNNTVFRYNKRILKLRPEDVQSQEFIPMIGVKPGKTIIYRKFSDGYYQGLVNKYTNSSTYFKIEYSDGDDELMDPFDLMNEIILNLSNIENILLQLSNNDVNNGRYIQQIQFITNLVKNNNSNDKAKTVNEDGTNSGSEINGVETSEKLKEVDITGHTLFKKMTSELRNYMLHQLINVEYISKRRKCSQ